MNLRSFYHLIALVLLFKAALLIYYYVYLSLAPSKDESRNSGFFEEHKSPTNLTNPLVNVYLEESFQPSFLLHNRNVKNIQSTNSHIMTSSIYSSKPASINVFRPVSCSALFNGDQSELKYSFTYLQQYSKRSRSAAEYSQLECSYLLSGGRYVLWPTSPEEDAFPIAFSIVTYRDIEQFERLLRAVYRPSNLICVHVDSKASDELWSSVNKIAECLNARYNNVIVTKNRVHPEWGRYSVLEADLNCMRDLHNARDRRKWHYFINLTGQEFPLRTNLELVRILSILNGANLMEAQNSAGRNRLSSPEKVPSGVHMYKGSVHIVASAAFVEFALNDSRAVKLLAYIRDHTYVPDEWFFSTLNHNPDALPAPGAYLEASKGALVNTDGPEEDMKISNVKYPFLARMKNWGSHPCRCAFLTHELAITHILVYRV